MFITKSPTLTSTYLYYLGRYLCGSPNHNNLNIGFVGFDECMTWFRLEADRGCVRVIDKYSVCCLVPMYNFYNTKAKIIVQFGQISFACTCDPPFFWNCTDFFFRFVDSNNENKLEVQCWRNQLPVTFD